MKMTTGTQRTCTPEKRADFTAGKQVVKWLRFIRGNKPFAEALSPPPPGFRAKW